VNQWLEIGIEDPAELDVAAHAELEREYGNRHRDGDAQAMLEYARKDAWCFRSAWFVEQLEQWRDDGEDKKLRSIMAAFTRNRVKTSHADLHTLISRDQEVFRAIIERFRPRSQGTLFGELANEFDLSEQSIELIRDEYQPYFEAERARGVSLVEFFRRLSEMAKRLTPRQ